ncbi:ankyrin repeat-containing domain protein [Plectosphaerella plurivora]|uniref:Ankyrin repeat-containing domain protein n=1 Tax=Plectosphaerella plurivora TaxID=936078 RepID=A0A9P8V9Q3_9PEZI|nr:ankyrin repeat-containing domain protein [Plectosphaerella plurivora]
MVKILPPYKPDIPEAPPGMVLSIMPAGHYYWVEDFEYFDQLGRDPMQRVRLWSITDDDERVTRMGKILDEFPKQKHRREMLHMAVARDDEALVRCIVATGIKVQPEIHPQPLSKEEEEARENGSIPDRDDPKIVPVHKAANMGRLGCLKILLEDGKADIDSRDGVGRTPLIAGAGHPEIVRYLLGRGADPAARTDDTDAARSELGINAGADALEFAAGSGSLESVKLLFEQPSARATPLAIQVAADMRGAEAYELLRLLLYKGGYPMQGRDGKTKGDLLTEEQGRVIDDAIPNAAMDGSLDSLRLLLEYRFPVDAEGELVMPLDLPESLHKPFIYGAYGAVVTDDRARFDFLRSFNIREHDTMSLDDVPANQTLNLQHLLDKAVETGATDMVRQLVDELGADVNAHRIPTGVKPLFYAAGNDRPAVVKQLIEEHGADIDLGSGRYATGSTALDIAVVLKSLESVEHLLRHGGPVDTVSEGVRGGGNVKAILRACRGDEGPSVVMETEEEATEYLATCRGDWQTQNPFYVRVELGPGDEALVDGLRPRKRAERLRETGPRARELRRGAEELAEGDVRAEMVEYPTFTRRQETLDEDLDLLPKFEPFLRAVEG